MVHVVELTRTFPYIGAKQEAFKVGGGPRRTVPQTEALSGHKIGLKVEKQHWQKTFLIHVLIKQLVN